MKFESKIKPRYRIGLNWVERSREVVPKGLNWRPVWIWRGSPFHEQVILNELFNTVGSRKKRNSLHDLGLTRWDVKYVTSKKWMKTHNSYKIDELLHLLSITFEMETHIIESSHLAYGNPYHWVFPFSLFSLRINLS